MLKIIVLGTCGLIAFQDFRERMVSWVLFPVMGIVLGFLYLSHVSFEQYYPFVIANLMLVTSIILVLFLYTKYFAKKEFLNVSFGLGDLLFFYAIMKGLFGRDFLLKFGGDVVGFG